MRVAILEYIILRCNYKGPAKLQALTNINMKLIRAIKPVLVASF